MTKPSTPSQTVGPFYSIGFDWLNRTDLTEGSVSGPRISIRGRIFDGDGKPVPDAVLEIWQADSDGRYAHPEDAGNRKTGGMPIGFGRVPVNDQGEFRFTTIKPGSVAAQAPHLVVSIFMRGLLRRLLTRIYFPADPTNDADPVLRLIPEHRRSTLIAQIDAADEQNLVWDVHLQGKNETVFFDY
jgi:protocatechuate 3,4-dioxygenase, alpha subunit